MSVDLGRLTGMDSEKLELLTKTYPTVEPLADENGLCLVSGYQYMAMKYDMEYKELEELDDDYFIIKYLASMKELLEREDIECNGFDYWIVPYPYRSGKYKKGERDEM